MMYMKDHSHTISSSDYTYYFRSILHSNTYTIFLRVLQAIKFGPSDTKKKSIIGKAHAMRRKGLYTQNMMLMLGVGQVASM